MPFSETYRKDMTVTRMHRPYEGSQGIQFTVEHRRYGGVQVTWKDLPVPKSEFCKMPFGQLPWLALRVDEYYCFVPVDTRFPNPCTALIDAHQLVEELVSQGMDESRVEAAPAPQAVAEHEF